ncbi:hypothetical protein C0993_010296, partial [Termitomyces sp. T159_Od127]
TARKCRSVTADDFTDLEKVDAANGLLNQLSEERAKVKLLKTQLCQAQTDQVRTAWMARGIFEDIVEQSNVELNSVQAQVAQMSQASSQVPSATAAQQNNALEQL